MTGFPLDSDCFQFLCNEHPDAGQLGCGGVCGDWPWWVLSRGWGRGGSEQPAVTHRGALGCAHTSSEQSHLGAAPRFCSVFVPCPSGSSCFQPR